MIVTAPSLENLTMTIAQEIHVRASLEATFDALLEQMGPANEAPDGTPLPLTIEAWPGGRWFRDLGQGNGHFWGSVQAIKRPTLLEITGPLFMSAPVTNNVQYRIDGSRRRHADGVPPLGVRLYPGRPQVRPDTGLDAAFRAHPEARRSDAADSIREESHHDPH